MEKQPSTALSGQAQEIELGCFWFTEKYVTFQWSCQSQKVQLGSNNSDQIYLCLVDLQQHRAGSKATVIKDHVSKDGKLLCFLQGVTLWLDRLLKTENKKVKPAPYYRVDTGSRHRPNEEALAAKALYFPILKRHQVRAREGSVFVDHSQNHWPESL